MKKEKWFGLLLAAGLIALLMVQPADSKKGADPTVDHIRAIMTAVNDQLEAMGENFRLGAVEYFTAKDEAGQIIYFDERTMRMGIHFVPRDPRRGGSTDITWLVDQTEGITGSGLTQAQTDAAIDRAMATWDGVMCSYIPLTKVTGPDDQGFTQWFFGFGGSYDIYADVTHGGWLPKEFFDLFYPDGGNIILGVTWTWYWATDIDNNNKYDAAFKDIYYNDNFSWAIDANYDVETVALHEAGHGLSQDHFGKLFLTDANGKFHFAPRAVMNSGYTGVQQVLKNTDIGGHCSIWTSWPYR